jgi:hypothetical protein
MQHGPMRAVDGNTETYWATQEKKATYLVNFQQSQTVSEISVRWKYIPQSYEVKYQVENIWKTIKFASDNKEAKLEMKFQPKVIQALKIEFLKNDPQYGVFQSKPIYGIESLVLKRNYHQILLLDCSDGESDNSNKWLLEDVEFIDDTIRPALQKEQGE